MSWLYRLPSSPSFHRVPIFDIHSYFAIMITAGILAVTVAASLPLSFATPTATKRAEPGPWCDDLGPSAFDTSPNFQLTAYNKTGDDTTGVPLVLGFTGTGQDVDGTTITFTVLSVSSSYSLSYVHHDPDA